MAAEEGVVHTTGNAAKSGVSIFTKKVGPLPAYVWMGAAIVLYLYFKKRNAASSASASTAANSAQTDSSGASGNIDPATGYVYGTTADTQALASQNSSTSTGSGSTTAGQYQTNQAWAEAAINYLVGLGIDPVEANSAVTQYISSQTLTTQQQADVNLAVQGIGGPPNPPTPGNAPPPVQTAGGGTSTVTANNPPTGFTATSKTDTTVTLSWNSVTNATAYVITWSPASGTGSSTTVGGTTLNTTVSGLTANTNYSFSCQATPAKSGDPSAVTTATTNKSTTIQGGNPPSGPGGPFPVGNTTTVTVVPFANPAPWNSTLSGIASHYNTTVAKIQALNPSITNPNLIYPGQQIIVPTS